MTAAWNPEFAGQSPAFAPLRAAARTLRSAGWPACDDFNRLLAAREPPILNAAGTPLRFVPQAPRAQAFADRYEPRIFLRAEVQLRAGDWHDLFNALVWLTFPRAKAALNARHYRALERRQAAGARNRGADEDTLTLFDESGVIVATADGTLGGLLAEHAWQELFWRRRHEVNARMRFYVFGHGLQVKMLRPFTGVTGRGVVIEVPAEFPALPLERQTAALDALLAARIAEPAHWVATRELMAVPVLGIPGWCRDNDPARYYDNSRYFRPATAAFTARRR